MVCRVTEEECSAKCPGEPTPCPECCNWMKERIAVLEAKIKVRNRQVGDAMAEASDLHKEVYQQDIKISALEKKIKELEK